MNYVTYSRMLSCQADMCLPFEYSFYQDMNINKHGKFVEIGCGNGSYLEALSITFPKLQYYGYDICHQLVELANTDRTNLNIKVGSTELLTNNVDVVLLRLVLGQILDRIDFIDKLTRKINQNCEIIIIDPLDDKFRLTPSLPLFYKKLGLIRDTLNPYRNARKVCNEIEQEMFKFGFNLLKTEHYFIPSLLPGYKDKYYQYMLATSMMLDASNEELIELKNWHNNRNSYAQMGLFIHLYKR